MQISGSVHANLRAALQCARRLRGAPVHPDTLDHWNRLLDFAKAGACSEGSYTTHELISDLQREVAARGASDSSRA